MGHNQHPTADIDERRSTSEKCHERTPDTLPNRSKTRSNNVGRHLAFWAVCPLARGRMRVKELAGKTVFVTGAASGIGLGIATAFAQAGAKVMLCDIEEAALSAALEQLRLTNFDVDGVKADASLKAELVAAAEATTARYGKVHILVNNAGVGGGGPYGSWTEASWDWTMGVNLMATIWGIEIFGPLIEQHGEGGHIVSTASIAGLISGQSNAYNVSKYGVVALSEGLRRELAPRGIGVSVLCPGFIRTQIMNSRRNLPKRFEGRSVPRRLRAHLPSRSV